jgi:hypothetical protein
MWVKSSTPSQPEYKTGVLPNQHQLEQKDQFFLLLPQTEPQVIQLPRVTKLVAISAWQTEIGLTLIGDKCKQVF